MGLDSKQFKSKIKNQEENMRGANIIICELVDEYYNDYNEYMISYISPNLEIYDVV